VRNVIVTEHSVAKRHVAAVILQWESGQWNIWC